MAFSVPQTDGEGTEPRDAREGSVDSVRCQHTYL